MKNTKFSRLLAMLLCLCIMASLAIPAFAAETSATIDYTKKASFVLHKVDFTNAIKDGVWNDAYVSTGKQDSNVEKLLIGTADAPVVRKGATATDGSSALGNSDMGDSYGYAIKGVEFTYLKVADITTYSAPVIKDGVTVNQTLVLYAFDKNTVSELLSAIGLTSDNRYAAADSLDATKIYFESDTLISALRSALASNATTVKNALEAYVVKYNGTKMALTDEYGMTSATNLDLGLYLLVETKVPEMVTNTTNPFFLSLPSTSVNGGGGMTSTSVTDGGQNWMYDLHLYPKNETSIPTLEKTVRESKDDTGNNNASTTITDGYAHTATGSTGDVMEYQLISTLPSITSDATGLSIYTFYDTLSAGLTYTKGDVKIEFFTDAACATTPVATWTEKTSNNFTVTYKPNETNDNTDTAMTIAMTADGLKEINTSTAVYSAASEVRRGYSDLTMRITYTAKLDSNNTVTFGDSGNPNTVVLTWARTSSGYYDTLIDDTHVYTYGIDLTKVFQGNTTNLPVDGDFSKVEFVLYNDTDDYWVKAELNETEGVYYVVDHMIDSNGSVSGYDGKHGDQEAQEYAEAAGATKFVPVTSGGVDGKVIIKGLEDDEYILTEITTDSGYALLQDHIRVKISTAQDEVCDIYSGDKLGVIQNDPRYLTVINADGVNNQTVLGLNPDAIPQKALEHKHLTASATVDGDAVTMLSDDGSVNAHVAMEVINYHVFDFPVSGETGAALLPIIGAGVFCVCGLALVIFLFGGKRKKEENAK